MDVLNTEGSISAGWTPIPHAIIDQGSQQLNIRDLASSAYSPVCPRPNGMKLVMPFTNIVGDIQGYVARDDDRREVIVAFRGRYRVGIQVLSLDKADETFISWSSRSFRISTVMGLDPDDSPDDNFPTNEIALELCNCDIWTFSWRSTRLIMRYHAQATLSERDGQNVFIWSTQSRCMFSISESHLLCHPPWMRITHTV
ncbi:hypothetical protein Ac2012v2_003495 [Leucoagaricus gongylophorus]